MSVYGAVEIGGTKCDVAFGTGIDDITEPVRIDTTDPEETLGAIVEVLSTGDITAVGIATFGPLNLETGTITSTPKSGWSDTPVRQFIESRCGVTVKVDVDVAGSALGEGRWGAAAGMTNYAYVTVGTGIGAAPVIGGRTIPGRAHPEAGHLVVTRHAKDAYPGRCPFHGDCLEGMASGPALADRFGPPDTWLSREAEITGLACHYLAQGMRDLVYTVAPERLVVGGGVSKLPGFHRELRRRLGELLGDYPEEPDLDLLISPPGLDELSGLAGALILAGQALG